MQFFVSLLHLWVRTVAFRHEGAADAILWSVSMSIIQTSFTVVFNLSVNE